MTSWSSHVLWWSDIDCTEFEQSQEYTIESQTKYTVILRCTQSDGPGQIWSLRCVDGQWINSDGEHPDCSWFSDDTRNVEETLLTEQKFGYDKVDPSGRLLNTMH